MCFQWIEYESMDSSLWQKFLVKCLRAFDKYKYHLSSSIIAATFSFLVAGPTMITKLDVSLGCFFFPNIFINRNFDTMWLHFHFLAQSNESVYWILVLKLDCWLNFGFLFSFLQLFRLLPFRGHWFLLPVFVAWIDTILQLFFFLFGWGL